MGGYFYSKRRYVHPDGMWADVTIARFPPESLKFEDIVLQNPLVRMRDEAHFLIYKALERGEDDPVAVTWACPEVPLAVSDAFPGLDSTTDDGEFLLDVGSFVTYTMRELISRGWLFRSDGRWQIAVSRRNSRWLALAGDVLQWLERGNRIWLETLTREEPGWIPIERFQPGNCAPIGRCGFLRDVVRQRAPKVAFNTSYFLLEQDDYVSHHSALGDPYGLLVRDGVIERPPLYRRGTIWMGGDGRWHVNRVGMEDVWLRLPGGLRLSPPGGDGPCFALNPTDGAEFALYTRHYGIESAGRPLGSTPESPGSLEITVVDRRIVGWKYDGGLLIPQNGFVLAIAPGAVPDETVESLRAGGKVSYGFARADLAGMLRAVQAGPELIRGGEVTLGERSLDDEGFWWSREVGGEYVVGVVPTDYSDEKARLRTGRLGIGVRADGGLVVVAAAGVNEGMEIEGVDSIGLDLWVLASLLAEGGAIEAVNLDGGGSTQLFFECGLATHPGDRRGRPGLSYERMIPSAGIA